MDLTIFQQRFSSLLESNRFTKKDVALAVGVSPAAISRYLNGDRVPDLRGIVKISEYFNVSIDWLLGKDDDRYAPLPKDDRELIELYALSTPDDKRVIWAVLGKYKDNKE